MSRPASALTALRVRKQLLVTEAELHRQEMIRDLHTISAALDNLARKARTVGTIASAVGLFVGGFSAWRGIRKSPPGHNGHPTFMSRLLHGVRLVSTVWRGWRSIAPKPRM